MSRSGRGKCNCRLAMRQFVLAAVTSVLITAADACCNVSKLQLKWSEQPFENKTGGVGGWGECGLLPSSVWRLGFLNATHAHTLQRPVWIAFAGDSQLRSEFWQLVDMIGGSQFQASPSFKAITANITSGGVRDVSLLAEAKYMDYKFCCSNANDASTCSVEVGGDAVTRLQARLRMVDQFLNGTSIDFTNIGNSTSAFLSDHPLGMCVTWKMTAYASTDILPVVTNLHMHNAVQPTAMLFNPGLHALTFRGNKQGSPGHNETVQGLQRLSTQLLEFRASGANTLHVLHNIMWANEQGLVDAYTGKGDVKRAVEFLGMSSSIDEWNADILTAITSTGHPFTIIDAKAVSDTARRLILRDCVHFKPRVYEALALIDLAVLFLELDVCPQQAQPR